MCTTSYIDPVSNYFDPVGIAFQSAASILSGGDPSFKFTSGVQPEASEQFCVLFANGNPRLLVPINGPLRRKAIASFTSDRKRLFLLPYFVSVASRIGGPFSSSVSHISLVSEERRPCQLRDLLTNTLGYQNFEIALRLSFGRPNAKTVAMAISNAGKPLCFAKFGSEVMTNQLVAHESATLDQFERLGGPVITPHRLYSGPWEGGPNVLITAPLNLKPLTRNSDRAHKAADAISQFTNSNNAILRNSDYWIQTSKKINNFSDMDNTPNDLTEFIKTIDKQLGEISFDFGPCHGDWSRSNVGLIGANVAALDWERFNNSAPRGIDIALFALSDERNRPFNHIINVDRVMRRIEQHLKSANVLSIEARSVLIFALLEMVIRFKSAQMAGLKTNDSKFRSALIKLLGNYPSS